jgi:hypothetical protein
MTTFKKTFQYFSVLCLLVSVQAHAEKPGICSNAISEIKKLTDPDRVAANSMMGVRPTYMAHLADGFKHGEQSGLIFKDADTKEPKVVAHGKGDILVMRPPNGPMKFFIQYDEAPYNGENDKGTKGGIYKVDLPADQAQAKPAIICPKNPKLYAHHYFPAFIPKVEGEQDKDPQVGDTYCVRSRDGKEYSLIRLTDVCENGLVFDFKHNGQSSFFKKDLTTDSAANLSQAKPKDAAAVATAQ